MYEIIKHKRQVAVMALLAMVFLFASGVEAAPNIPNSTSDIRAIDLDNSVGDIIRRVVNFIGIIGGVILVGLGMWHGISAATSGKNPNKRAEAWDSVKYYIIAAAFFFAVPLVLGVLLRLMNV